MTSEARHFTRLPFQSESSLEADGRINPCRLVDISLHGALVEALEGPFPVVEGAAVLLRIQVEESPVEIEMAGLVAWISDQRLGVQCTAIDVDSMTHLRRLMELNLGDPGLLDRELLEMR